MRINFWGTPSIFRTAGTWKYPPFQDLQTSQILGRMCILNSSWFLRNPRRFAPKSAMMYPNKCLPVCFGPWNDSCIPSFKFKRSQWYFQSVVARYLHIISIYSVQLSMTFMYVFFGRAKVWSSKAALKQPTHTVICCIGICIKVLIRWSPTHRHVTRIS